MTSADRIEDLARKATQGKWVDDDPPNWHGLYARVASENPYGMIAQVPIAGWRPKSIGRANAAYIAYLCSRGLAIARVLRAAAKEPWIMRGQDGDDFEYGCEGCNYSIIEGRVHHGRDCLFGELRSALSALEAMEEA